MGALRLSYYENREVSLKGHFSTEGALLINHNFLKVCPKDFSNQEKSLYCFPFGMTLPNRHETQGDGYRYGFNGMEKDDEITGTEGSHLDFGARVYDSRVGRFLSNDPRESDYPYQSTYVYAANSPILFIDENGEGPIIPFQSFTASESMRSYIAILESTDDPEELDRLWGEFRRRYEKYMSIPFSKVASVKVAKEQFENNKETLGELHYGKSGYDFFNNEVTFYGPDVAYQNGEVDDMFNYFVLINKDENGNWYKEVYKVLNMDLYHERVDPLTDELKLIQSQIDELLERNSTLEDNEKVHEESRKLGREARLTGGIDGGGSFAAGSIFGFIDFLESKRNEAKIKELNKAKEKIEQKIEQINNEAKDTQISIDG